MEQTPQTPAFLDAYAWTLFKKGDFENALTYQQAAVEKSEAEGDISAELYSHFGDILFRNGRREDAIEYWKKALELSPDDEGLQTKVKSGTM